MKTNRNLLLSAFLAATALILLIAAVPSTSNFNSTQFVSAGSGTALQVSIVNGADMTNLNVNGAIVMSGIPIGGMISNPNGTNTVAYDIVQTNLDIPAITGNGSVTLLTTPAPAHFAATIVDPHPTSMGAIVQMQFQSGFTIGAATFLFAFTNLTAGDTNDIKGAIITPVSESAVESTSWTQLYATNETSNSLQIYAPSSLSGLASTDKVLITIPPK